MCAIYTMVFLEYLTGQMERGPIVVEGCSQPCCHFLVLPKQITCFLYLSILSINKALLMANSSFKEKQPPQLLLVHKSTSPVHVFSGPYCSGSYYLKWNLFLNNLLLQICKTTVSLKYRFWGHAGLFYVCLECNIPVSLLMLSRVLFNNLEIHLPLDTFFKKSNLQAFKKKYSEYPLNVL